MNSIYFELLATKLRERGIEANFNGRATLTLWTPEVGEVQITQNTERDYTTFYYDGRFFNRVWSALMEALDLEVGGACMVLKICEEMGL